MKLNMLDFLDLLTISIDVSNYDSKQIKNNNK